MDKKKNLYVKTGISTVVMSSFLLFAADDFHKPLTSISVEASTVTKYTTTANLNMRSTNSTKGKVLIVIPKGKEVSYISKSGNWYKVKYNGKTGWVSSTYIKTSKVAIATTKATTTTTYTTTANLNLRSTNSTKGKILLTIPKGKAVSYISKSGNWYKVKYNGKTGWVSASYIKVTKKQTTASSSNKNTTSSTTPTKNTTNVTTTTQTTYTTTANLNLRSTNSTKGKVLLTIPKGKEVSYMKKSGNWYQVKYNGKTGWVSASYIKVTTKQVTVNNKNTTNSSGTTNSTNKNTTNSNTTVSNGKIYTTTANLNLRSTNSTSGNILLTIPKGKEVTYISQSNNWYKVNYNGKIGWVSATYIKITSKTNTNTSNGNSSVQTPTNNTNLPAGQTITNTVVYTTDAVRFRKSNSTSSTVLGTIPANTKFTTNYKTTNGWYYVTYNGQTGFVSGNYLISQSTKDRITKLESNKNSYLFMDLRTQSSVTAEQINAYINSRVGNNQSVLKNSGKYFIEAGNKFGVNALYLAAHAIHESDYGKSRIALDRYNLFGYGAYDLVPYLGAVKFASIQQNIDFIAQKMKASYLGNSYLNQGTYLGYSVKSVNGVRVDSLSKGMNFYYASDERWGEKIAAHMTNILAYANEGAKNKQPNTIAVSNPSYPNGSDVFPTATLAVARSQINLYSTKSTGTVVATIKKGDEFNLLEKDNNYWLKVQYKGKVYYTKVAFNAYKDYFTVKNLGRVSSGGYVVNVRDKATTSNSNVISTVNHKDYVELVMNNYQIPVTENGFYKVKVNGKVGWIYGEYIVRELNK